MPNYKVNGTMVFNVSMVVEADDKDEAEKIALDRMEDGYSDQFILGESVGDNDVHLIKEIS